MLHRTISNLICIITFFPKTLADVIVSTLAGSGSAGSADGAGTAASFRNPTGLALDSSGILYVADRYNNLLRRVTSTGVVTTYAGGGSTTVTDSNGNPASFNQPNALVFDATGNLFIADVQSNRIKKITPSNVFSTFGGNGTFGSTDGVGINATFAVPNGIAIDAFGNLYITEWGGNRLRKMTSSGVVTTFAGSSSLGNADGAGQSATLIIQLVLQSIHLETSLSAITTTIRAPKRIRI